MRRFCPLVSTLLGGLVLAVGNAQATDPLAALNDEFDDAATLADWQDIRIVEGWPNVQWESIDIDATRDGWLTMVPYTVVWYEDYRGPLLFKTLSGDFAATARVQATNRAGTGAPNREYSLGGIMVRAPRAITPATWTPGQERYSFLSVGAASLPGNFQYEVKSTSNFDELPEYSRLDLQLTGCNCGDTLIQTVRIGTNVIQLAQPAGQPWRVINRYRRPDLPATVQVGLVTYTNWEIAQGWPTTVHNVSTITTAYNQPAVPSQPDLRAQVDYLRFVIPAVPPAFQGVDLVNPAVASDAQLLSFLGENLTTAYPTTDSMRVH